MLQPGPCVAMLKLRVQAHRGDRCRSTVPIVGGMIDPLIVEAQMRKVKHCERIIGLEDLLGPWVRQTPVAYEDAQSAGVQVTLARRAYAVVDRGQTQSIVCAPPARPLQR